MKQTESESMILVPEPNYTPELYDGTNMALKSAGTWIGIVGVRILSTAVEVRMAIGLEISAVVFGVGGAISKFISLRLLVKSRKQDSICVLCMSKLNTISNLTSTAFIDGKISDEEFKMIIDEIGKFQQMKTDIHAKTAKAYKEITIGKSSFLSKK